MLTVGIIDNGADIGLWVKWVDDRIVPTVADAVRKDAKELEAAAKRRALNLRMGSGGGDHSLRRALAAAIVTRVTKHAVSFVLSGDRMPPGKQSMPFASINRTFTHPVFGHTVTVTEAGDPGWFAKAIIEQATKILPRDITQELSRLVEHPK